MKDSILAIADESYFDWPTLPEAPSSLRAVRKDNAIVLSWQPHNGNPLTAIVERRLKDGQEWQTLITQSASKSEYSDSNANSGGIISYRVRLANSSGRSAYSNVVRIKYGD
jgi:hypothetical protein